MEKSLSGITTKAVIMMNDFLPEDYKVPDVAGNYTKFEQGENRLRILASPILGWEWWTEDEQGRHPNRVESVKDVPKEFKDEAKHFWAMPVYNYKEERIQVMEITQKSIMAQLRGLANDEEWGSPLNYDISVIREGESLDTKYQVIPSPPKKLKKEIKEVWEETEIDLEQLYEGGDPFNPEIE